MHSEINKEMSIFITESESILSFLISVNIYRKYGRSQSITALYTNSKTIKRISQESIYMCVCINVG